MIKYDLIYATVWHAARTLEIQYPSLSNKIVFTGHGRIDFINILINSMSHIYISENQVENFNLEPDLVSWLKNKNFSVVSQDLYNLFVSPPYNFDPNSVFLTQCGADDEIYANTIKELDKNLKVICGVPLKSAGSALGYDVKRLGIIEKIRKKLEEDGSNIEFIFPHDYLPLEQMKDFYVKGDILLCVSHSEGNPLGPFEASGCGVITISTKVGEMPNFIIDGFNGFLIENNIDVIENDIIDRLKKLENDRELLKKMKNQAKAFFLNHRTWKQKIRQWDNFFLSCIEKNIISSYGAI